MSAVAEMPVSPLALGWRLTPRGVQCTGGNVVLQFACTGTDGVINRRALAPEIADECEAFTRLPIVQRLVVAKRNLLTLQNEARDAQHRYDAAFAKQREVVKAGDIESPDAFGVTEYEYALANAKQLRDVAIEAVRELTAEVEHEYTDAKTRASARVMQLTTGARAETEQQLLEALAEILTDIYCQKVRDQLAAASAFDPLDDLLRRAEAVA